MPNVREPLVSFLVEKQFSKTIFIRLPIEMQFDCVDLFFKTIVEQDEDEKRKAISFRIATFNELFIQFAKETKVLFDKNDIIYPQHFIGLNLLIATNYGQEIHQKLLKNQLKELKNKIQNLNKIELSKNGFFI